MHSRVYVLPCLAFAAVLAHGQQAQTKVGIIHVQNAIISTKDGQKIAGELQARFDPRRKEIEKRQTEIQALRDQLNRGSNTMSDEAKQTLIREIDQKSRSANRASEDAQADFEQDRDRVLQELGQRMMVVIDKYARDNGYALIVDVSSPQTPVLYASNTIDITNDIVALYDKNAPSAAPSAPAAAPPPVLVAPAKPAGLPPATKKK